MHRRVTHAVTAFSRLAAWIHEDYPEDAPERGHCYLLALLGADHASHRASR